VQPRPSACHLLHVAVAAEPARMSERRCASKEGEIYSITIGRGGVGGRGEGPAKDASHNPAPTEATPRSAGTARHCSPLLEGAAVVHRRIPEPSQWPRGDRGVTGLSGDGPAQSGAIASATSDSWTARARGRYG
jgi:hypothetical protein